MSEEWVFIIGFVVLCVVCLFGALFIGSLQCQSKWERSGMEVSWGPVQGCMVQLKDGRWIPAESVRNLD